MCLESLFIIFIVVDAAFSLSVSQPPALQVTTLSTGQQLLGPHLLSQGWKLLLHRAR